MGICLNREKTSEVRGMGLPIVKGLKKGHLICGFMIKSGGGGVTGPIFQMPKLCHYRRVPV